MIAAMGFPFLDQLYDIAVPIFITRTALPITSALRFWPLGPFGIARSPTLYKLANASTGHHEENWQKG
jgi:hypothetical protein